MPLLDHFHPPLHGPRRWEGFHHSWAALIAQQLNLETLPPGYFAESEISLGPTLEIDVATTELTSETTDASSERVGTAVWSPPRPRFAARVDFAHLDSYEIKVFQDLGGAELRAAIELVSPANKDRDGSRRTFAAKCAGYLQHGIHLVIVDVVTARSANLHRELADVLEIKGRPAPMGIVDGALRRGLSRRDRPETAARRDLAGGARPGHDAAGDAALAGTRPLLAPGHWRPATPPRAARCGSRPDPPLARTTRPAHPGRASTARPNRGRAACGPATGWRS